MVSVLSPAEMGDCLASLASCTASKQLRPVIPCTPQKIQRDDPFMNSLPARSDALLGDRLKALGPARLNGMRRGIEKESLRAQANGSLALTPHPAALGSALTHPSITTDFS
jgi:hypothetical protein